MPDFTKMTPTEFAAWQAEQNNPPVSSPATFASDPVPPQRPADRYAATTWAETEFDFTTPSGQLCRMRKVPIEELIELGLQDKLNTLAPRVDDLITKSSNQPPKPEVDADLDPKVMRDMLGVMNDIIPMVVLQPTVHPDPKDPTEKKVGLIYVSSIELADRLAILNKTLGGLEKLANFRE